MSDRTFFVETSQQREHLAGFISRQAPPFRVVLGELKRKRTSEQNARLWLLHTAVAEVTGYSPEDMHEFSLCRFFGSKTETCAGITLTTPLKRSSQRDRKEFTEFMESTEIWYGETFGVWI